MWLQATPQCVQRANNTYYRYQNNTARDALGMLGNQDNMWAEFQTGGGAGGNGFRCLTTPWL